MNHIQETVLVLDAMGVIYTAADDVEELLIPFILEQRGLADSAAIARYYLRASLGEIDAVEFWQAVGLSPDVEDDYLSRPCRDSARPLRPSNRTPGRGRERADPYG